MRQRLELQTIAPITQPRSPGVRGYMWQQKFRLSYQSLTPNTRVRGQTIAPVSRPKVQVFTGRCGTSRLHICNPGRCGNKTPDYSTNHSAQKCRCSRVDVATEVQTIAPVACTFGPSKSKCPRVVLKAQVSRKSKCSMVDAAREFRTINHTSRSTQSPSVHG